MRLWFVTPQPDIGSSRRPAPAAPAPDPAAAAAEAVEAENSKEEMYGMTRLLEALNQNPDGTAKELIENVIHSIEDFVKDASQFDDTTMLALRYLGPVTMSPEQKD